MNEDKDKAPQGDDRAGRDSGMTAKPDVHAGGVDENAGGMGAGPDDEPGKD